MELYDVSEGKYKKNNSIGGGAFSNIYNVNLTCKYTL